MSYDPTATYLSCPNANNNCTSPNFCSTVCSNDDILGIGIRINFYSTMVLLALIPRTPDTKQLLNVLTANTGIAGLCLLITAIQQTFSHELSLFHAIFVHHILFFLGIGIAPVGTYKWSRNRIAMGVVIQFVLVIAFTSWALYLWARVEHFGSQPYLNYKVKYVLMFVNIRATASWLRGVWITATVISTIVLSIIFGYNALALFSMSREEGAEDPDRGWFFHISYTQILIAIYSTVMLEVTVQRNSTQHHGAVQVDNNWAFGQTLAVVMIFSNLNEVIHFLIGYYTRRGEGSQEPPQEAERASNHTAEAPADVAYRPRGLPAAYLSARHSTHAKLSPELELSNLNKENSQVQVSELTGSGNPVISDQPVGTLR